MTDSADDRENTQSDSPEKFSVDFQIPGDTEWELEHQVPFETGGKHDLTSAIVVGVAEAEDVPPMEIKEPPLYDVLDIAALEDALFGSSDVGKRSGDYRQVEFMYRSHRVVIRSDGWVQVYRFAEK